LGTVFELAPLSGGRWKETVVHSFGTTGDGTEPRSSVILDSEGDLYGTTWFGGGNNYGTVYELAPKSGKWQESLLYSFSPGQSGVNPIAGLIFDSLGSLYGATAAGGTYGAGNIFRLTRRSGGGAWSLAILYSFRGASDGNGPYSTPAFDGSGNLYGTTNVGGTKGFGTVFQLQPSGVGYKFILLHTFTGSDGGNPQTGVTLDSAGNVYGTTTGQLTNGNGTVFELTPASGGKWQETVLYSFTGGSDGASPAAPVTFDSLGNIYGTALTGGLGSGGGNGVVFEITP
jgi:uncharacterized repeat protein (TIGR03803 family)